jgi:hypothetical protein
MTLFALIYFGCIVLCGVAAHYKSRRIWVWVVFGVIFWAAALVLVLLLPSKFASSQAERAARSAR